MKKVAKKKEYKKKFTVIVIADKQGVYFEDVLKSLYDQTLDNSKYEVIICVNSTNNIDPVLIEEYRKKFHSMTKIIKIGKDKLSDILNNIAKRKIRVNGEYVTFLRSINTYHEDALEAFDRMNGDILVMNLSHSRAKTTARSLKGDLGTKKVNVLLRKAGIHTPSAMTTKYPIDLGKMYHIRLFKFWEPMDKLIAGTSTALYAFMLSHADDVFYYPKSCGVWRDGRGDFRKQKLTPKEISSYQKAIKHLVKHNDPSSNIMNKVAFLTLYNLVRDHRNQVPKITYDIKVDASDLYNNYIHLPIFPFMKNKMAKKSYDRIRLYLGTRIKY